MQGLVNPQTERGCQVPSTVVLLLKATLCFHGQLKKREMTITCNFDFFELRGDVLHRRG